MTLDARFAAEKRLEERKEQQSIFSGPCKFLVIEKNLDEQVSNLAIIYDMGRITMVQRHSALQKDGMNDETNSI